ncbi:replication-associated protein [Dragonfly larvae associated circular virus-9]|uniref:Replication-associated protein n=1 Tax=Dragonfly larvae associated circular virus-9 TaxID=1454030 RepID=W5U1T1_9VIRU|nr:replication-associated protein [Dragonfly larvae associated circular virus-9]AHH31481.1 replication-associated protein [Dragonfly larvae associated circular virus-9]
MSARVSFKFSLIKTSATCCSSSIPKMGHQVKRWCFTLNNYTEEEYKEIVEKIEWTYIIIGREVGEEGTPHLQGYIELKKKSSLNQIKKVNQKIHWEQLRGKPFQAADYCKKENNFQEWGHISMSGGGTTEKIGAIIEKAKSGGMREVLKDPPKLATVRLIEKYLSYCEEERKEKPYVHWNLGNITTYTGRMTPNGGDGYDKNETIVIDDFRASIMRFTYLLRILDRYPMRVEVKGGYRQLNSKNIVITSIIHPESCYHMENEPIRQLMRRIDKITETNNKNILNDVMLQATSEESVGNTNLHFLICDEELGE